MDTKAFRKLAYGIFAVSVKDGEETNGCITNTCIQVASNPPRIAISCINANYTTELIKRSGEFAVSVLDRSCPFSLIKHFGMQSGRNVVKFSSSEFEFGVDEGIPYVVTGACAMLRCKVTCEMDLSSHTLFIAEVADMKVLSDGAIPLTYDWYQSDLKPKAAGEAQRGRKIKGWRCKICGYVYEGEKLPDGYACPLCGHPIEDFEPVYE